VDFLSGKAAAIAVAAASRSKPLACLVDDRALVGSRSARRDLQVQVERCAVRKPVERPTTNKRLINRRRIAAREDLQRDSRHATVRQLGANAVDVAIAMDAVVVAWPTVLGKPVAQLAVGVVIAAVPARDQLRCESLDLHSRPTPVTTRVTIRSSGN